MGTTTGRTTERVIHRFSAGDLAALREGAPRGLVGTTVEVLGVLRLTDDGEQRLRVRLHADGTERAVFAGALEPRAKARAA